MTDGDFLQQMSHIMIVEYGKEKGVLMQRIIKSQVMVTEWCPIHIENTPEYDYEYG